MAIRIACKNIEDLPAQQVLQIIGRVTGNILNQTITVRERGPAVLLVFPFMPKIQLLAKVLLVQSCNLAALILDTIIAFNQRIVCLRGRS